MKIISRVPTELVEVREFKETDRMADEFMFRIGDIPREKLVKPTEFIERCSTVLIYENQPFGSGTFVKCGDRFGILTAYHVPYNTTKDFNFRPNSPDKLGLAISNFKHAFYIEMQYLNPYSIGFQTIKNMVAQIWFFLKYLTRASSAGLRSIDHSGIFPLRME